MEIAGAVINNPVTETLMLPVTNQIRYLIFCTKYMRNMRTKMGELNFARVGVEEHMNKNIRSRLEVPDQVRGWLEEVGKINAKVENIPHDVGSCFLFISRHKLGRKAFKITEEIESAKIKHSQINWTDYPIPPGKVDSFKASTSMPSIDHHDDFESRKQTFTDALQALQPDHKCHMIALCGMGGVGKTTMMQRLKKVVQEKKMFNFFFEAVIGEKTEPTAIQEAVANYLGIELKETTKPARADKLRNWFNDNLVGSKKKLLVILDDVWELVDLNDIGLSPLPNQGVDFKVLLTSRDKDVCIKMGVEDNSIIDLKHLTEAEAQILFRQFLQNSDYVDNELHKIGEEIVRKCCGLPIAIKTIAYTLKGGGKHVWEDALARLQHRDIYNVVNEVFEISYNNLQDQESKAIFLLCGLFPEDYNIPIEDLMRYGWGLKLFNRVDTIREARNRLNTCVDWLIHKNLLMETEVAGRIKMHDLALTFVLNMFSKVEHAVIVNHGSRPGWPEENDVSNSCKRISLTCKGMTEIPSYLKFPRLSILKLMHGDESLRFPENFYKEMEKVQVISYDNMKYPLLPSSIHFSPNLRVLHLHQCSLMMFDCSSIGNLSNLEVLSFSQSRIEWLPSTLGKLEKLRLLDLTECAARGVEKGVLQNLVKLEELYMGVDGLFGLAIILTAENYNEIAQRSENLYALEFEFFEDNVQPQNMSFENLHRFKISVGCSFGKDFHKSGNSFENKLQLVTKKDEVLKSRMNQLFKKTDVLFLSVEDMNELGDIGVNSSHLPQSSSFQNLRVLYVLKCAELRHLFTPGVAKTLSKLEHLVVKSCDNMEELVHTGDSGVTFPKLKILSLRWLPKLSGLCHNVNIIELPQLVELELDNIPGFTSIYPKNKLDKSCLLKEEIIIPKLEKMHINHMEDLKEIWPCELGASDDVNVSMLRGIKVMNCDSLVNLFPCNPMPFTHHLEELEVRDCGSIEVLFNLDSVGEIGEGSNLRSIEVSNLSELREVWRIKVADNSRLPIHGFQAVKSVKIEKCRRFRNIFTPITANFDLGALMEITIQNVGGDRTNDEWVDSSQEKEDELVESSREEEITILSKEEEISQIRDSISNIVFPSCLIHSFHNLRKLEMSNYEGMEVVFEIESPRSRELVTTHDNQQRILPNLEDLEIRDMHNINHVWKCNWNNFINLQKQPLESPFHNLTTIQMKKCKSIKYLFSPLMAKLLSNLQKIEIDWCDGIEEVVSNKDDEDEENTMSTSTHRSCTDFFPHFDSLTLTGLSKFKCIGGGGSCANGGNNKLSLNNSTTTTHFVDQFKFSEAGGVSWSLCQYAKEIIIKYCHALSSVIPCYAAGQMQKLQLLKIEYCDGMKEVFETQGMSGCDEVNIQQSIPRQNHVIMLKLHNLKILEIRGCHGLEHVFPFSALGSLGKLEELSIWNCKAMKVIVKEEEESSKEVVVFPCLKSITLYNLPNLKGFFLGMNMFQWRSLDKVTIQRCPEMTVFAPGGSTAPHLKHMHIALGKYSAEECGLNFHAHVTDTAHHQTPLFPSLDGSSSCPATSEQGRPWSFHNLIEIHLLGNHDVEKIIPSNELLQLQKLEKIHVSSCYSVKEVFEEAGRNSSTDESQTTTTTTLVTLPNLREIQLLNLPCLRYMWKSNQWTVFQFPNLTTISIHLCESLKHVFSSSMVGSLLKLQELHIRWCKDLEEVIVKDSNDGVEELEESDAKTNQIITLPRLKSLSLVDLPRLKGFCLGKEDFSFPLLDTLEIFKCPAITTFTNGLSATPKLREILIDRDSFYAGEDINSFIKINQEELKKDW